LKSPTQRSKTAASYAPDVWSGSTEDLGSASAISVHDSRHITSKTADQNGPFATSDHGTSSRRELGNSVPFSRTSARVVVEGDVHSLHNRRRLQAAPCQQCGHHYHTEAAEERITQLPLHQFGVRLVLHGAPVHATYNVLKFCNVHYCVAAKDKQGWGLRSKGD